MAVLYVVATPIGNLQDFSPRGEETLRKADLIIAEDTRVTMKLCQVFNLKAPLVSCHRHSEDSKAAGLAQKIINEDLSAALVTDAGTPCISDPGSEVVRECAATGIKVIPIPGCCAGIAALSISGYDAREFAFSCPGKRRICGKNCLRSHGESKQPFCTNLLSESST